MGASRRGDVRRASVLRIPDDGRRGPGALEGWRGPTATPPLCRRRGEGRGDRWGRVATADAFLDACWTGLMRLVGRLRWVALAKGRRGGGSVWGL